MTQLLLHFVTRKMGPWDDNCMDQEGLAAHQKWIIGGPVRLAKWELDPIQTGNIQ